jgi:hypothetical protein
LTQIDLVEISNGVVGTALQAYIIFGAIFEIDMLWGKRFRIEVNFDTTTLKFIILLQKLNELSNLRLHVALPWQKIVDFLAHDGDLYEVSILSKEIERSEQLFPIFATFVDLLNNFGSNFELFFSYIRCYFWYIMTCIHMWI